MHALTTVFRLLCCSKADIIIQLGVERKEDINSVNYSLNNITLGNMTYMFHDAERVNNHLIVT